MTRKLYYEDCHLTSFEAKVVRCEKTDRGFEVILDATAFYPEGGGQACDLGTLNNAQVLDVQEMNGEIVHFCDRPLTAGAEVAGSIDWQRRFDLMQQHTGEHIVSGIIHARYSYHNVGFHMGADVVTIDFDGPIPADALPEIETQANQILWQDLQVTCWYPAPEELPGFSYRSKKQLDWPVRLVQIPQADLCACCGVHVPRTGQIGLIKLLSCVKFHQGVRIEMACGRRALALLNKIYEQNRLVSQAFSAKIMETGDAARKMNDRLAAAEGRCVQLQRQIFAAIAKEFAGQENALYFGDLTAGETRELAEAILPGVSGKVLVCGGEEGKFSFCLAANGDVKAAGTALCAALGGRGGGKPPFFQGSLTATRAQIEAYWE